MLSQKDRTTAAIPTPEEEGGIQHFTVQYFIRQLTHKVKCDVTCKQHESRWQTEGEKKSHSACSLQSSSSSVLLFFQFLLFTCAWLWVSVGTAAHSLSLLLSVLAGDKKCLTRALWARRQWCNCHRRAEDSSMKKIANKTFFFFKLVCFCNNYL